MLHDLRLPTPLKVALTYRREGGQRQLLVRPLYVVGYGDGGVGVPRSMLTSGKKEETHVNCANWAREGENASEGAASSWMSSAHHVGIKALSSSHVMVVATLSSESAKPNWVSLTATSIKLQSNTPVWVHSQDMKMRLALLYLRSARRWMRYCSCLPLLLGMPQWVEDGFWMMV